MATPLADIINTCLAGALDLSSAQEQSERLGDNPEAIVSELWEIAKNIDQLKGTRRDYELISSLICWYAAHRISNVELKSLLAFNLGRSFLFNNESDQAQVYLDKAKGYALQIGNRSRLKPILLTQAWIAMTKGNQDAALALFRETYAIARELGNPFEEAHSAYGIGQVLAGSERHEARDKLIRALELFRSLGERLYEFRCLALLGQIAYTSAEDREIVRLLSQAISLTKVVTIEPVEVIQVLERLGGAQVGLGALTDAKNSYEQGLQLASEIHDPLWEGYFAGNLGAVYLETKHPEEAQNLLEQALSIAETCNDADGIAITRQNLSRLKKLYPDSKVTHLDKQRRSSLPNSTEHTSQLRQRDKGQNEENPAIFEQLVALATRIRDDRQIASKILSDLKPTSMEAYAASDIVESILRLVNEQDKKDPYLAYALVVVLERWIPDGIRSNLLFDVYHKLGSYAWRSNDSELAVYAYSIVCDIARKSNLVAQFLESATNLGSVLRQAGQVRKAYDVYMSAIKTFDETTSPALESMVLINASTACADLGLHEQAKEMCERAIRLLVKQPSDKLSLAIAWINLSGSLSALGNIEASEEATLNALHLTREEKIPSQEAVALGHLGLIRARQGRIGDALHYLQTALSIAEDLQDLWNAQHWYRDIANVYTWTGSPEIAVEYIKKALSLSRKVGDSRSEGICLLGLGINLLSKDLEESLVYLQQAWQVQENTGSLNASFDVALHLSRAYTTKALDMKDIRAAMLTGVSWRMLTTKPLVKDVHALGLARHWLDHARELNGLAKISDGEISLVLFEVPILNLEGRIQDAIAGLQRILDSYQESDQRPISVYHCYHALANIYHRDLDRPDLALSYYERTIVGYEALTENLEWSEHRIQFRNDFAPVYSEIVECAMALNKPDIAFAYWERSKLIEMRRLWSLRQQSPTEVPELSSISRLLIKRGTTAVVEFIPTIDKTYVFVIAPGLAESEQVLVLDDVCLIQLGASWWTRVMSAYEDFKSPISAFDLGARERWHVEVEAICEQIGAQLLQPVFAKIKSLSLQQIVFVPPTILHLFPLHAAPLSEKERWIDRYCISYAPSASVIYHKWTTSTTRPKTFVGFADSMEDLPMTRIEVQRAADLFSGPTKLYYGQDVSMYHVIKALGQADWIHFACHAKQVLLDNYSTGLYLSNAEPNESSNFLDLFTINRDVRLPNNTTIVLSACETGAVTPYLSEELVSIAGGFIAAGADTVIATYWKVRDACAILILDRLYTNIHNGYRLSNALRDAQIWIRDLNEAQVFESLKSLIGTTRVSGHTVSDGVLASFAERRLTYKPFGNTADWAAFFLTGRT